MSVPSAQRSLGDALTVEAREMLRQAANGPGYVQIPIDMLQALLVDGDRLEWLGSAPWEELKIVESYIIDGNGARTAIDWVRGKTP